MKDVDYGKVVKKGVNDIKIKTTKAGYIVEMNDENLKDYAPNVLTDYLVKSELGFDKISKVRISKLKGKMKTMQISEEV